MNKSRKILSYTVAHFHCIKNSDINRLNVENKHKNTNSRFESKNDDYCIVV